MPNEDVAGAQSLFRAWKLLDVIIKGVNIYISILWNFQNKSLNNEKLIHSETDITRFQLYVESNKQNK